MTTSKDAWTEVGNRLNALGLKLKLHAREEQSAQEADERSALDKIGDAVKEAFEGIGDALKDPAVKEDVRATLDGLATAIRATVDDVTEAVRPGRS